MRIAFFADTYYPDLNGVSISVNNFARELRKKGHTVYIFAPKLKGAYEDKDQDLIRLSSFKVIPNSEPKIYSPAFWPNKNFIKIFTLKFDIVHAHGNGFFSLLGYIVARIRRIPFIMTFHTIHTLYTHYIFKGKLITPKMVEAAFKIAAHRCNRIIVPSRKMKMELIKYGVKKKIFVVPNFLDIERFTNIKPHFLHELLNLSQNTPLLVTVGRVGKEKNIDFIIRVFKKLTEKEGRSHLVIVGKGPEKENLINLAKSLGISNRTHFTDRIDYKFMPQVYKDAAIFVFASYTETQGVCVLEAAMAGVPCVINDDKAFEGMIVDGKNGFSLPLDERQFVDKISFLLEHEDERRIMSEYAVKLAVSNFSPSKITDNLIDIYKGL